MSTRPSSTAWRSGRRVPSRPPIAASGRRSAATACPPTPSTGAATTCWRCGSTTVAAAGASGACDASGRPAAGCVLPRWWTVVLVNWDDEAEDVATGLADLGIGGSKFAAYDVWQNTPLPDLDDKLTARLEPHSVLVAALRPAAPRPQLIGTTRHVVQGVVDVAEESWDQGSRTLRARSTNLDARPYAVTIAVPRGLRPSACKADLPCTMKTLPSGHVRVEWRENPEGRDIRWEIAFRRPPARERLSGGPSG